MWVAVNLDSGNVGKSLQKAIDLYVDGTAGFNTGKLRYRSSTDVNANYVYFLVGPSFNQTHVKI